MIEYLVMDVDGTLTDGKIYMSSSGEAMKAFNIKDGLGIHDLLPTACIIPIIITGRDSDIVTRRCSELGINNIYQGVSCKLRKLNELVNDFSSVAYIGDDINDLSCMQEISTSGGLVGCPADAVQDVRNVADYISPFKGGEGAVRDFIEWIIRQYEGESVNDKKE